MAGNDLMRFLIAKIREEADMDTYLGLDFGGTKLLIGEVDEKGTVINCKRYRTGVDNQKNAVDIIFQSLADYCDTVGFQGNLRAAGLGIIGIVNSVKGEWLAMGDEVTASPIPLAGMLQQRLQVPCAIDNDVKAATTAELLMGQGRFSDDFIFLNVGTGLAAGIVSGGRIIRGANNKAGEVGHTVVDFRDQSRCSCGRTGCVENFVSGIGFTRCIRECGRKDLLDGYGRADVEVLLEKADQGDVTCIKIIEYGAKVLANVIMNLVRVSDPDTVILGGGIIANDGFRRRVEAYLVPETMRNVTKGIILSQFDPNYAGITGAAALGMTVAGKADAVRITKWKESV